MAMDDIQRDIDRAHYGRREEIAQGWDSQKHQKPINTAYPAMRARRINRHNWFAIIGMLIILAVLAAGISKVYGMW
jgi:hypothetical protein